MALTDKDIQYVEAVGNKGKQIVDTAIDKYIGQNKHLSSLWSGILTLADFFGIGTAIKTRIKKDLQEENWENVIDALTKRINAKDISGNSDYTKILDTINNITSALYSVSGHAANKLAAAKNSLMEKYNSGVKLDNAKLAYNNAQKEYLLSKTDKMKDIMESGDLAARSQLTDLQKTVEQGLKQFI